MHSSCRSIDSCANCFSDFTRDAVVLDGEAGREVGGDIGSSEDEESSESESDDDDEDDEGDSGDSQSSLLEISSSSASLKVKKREELVKTPFTVDRIEFTCSILLQSVGIEHVIVFLDV